MPVSPRAARLRADLEQILGAPVRITAENGTEQLRAPAPDGTDDATWQRVIDALGAADQWGSSESTGTPEIWANVTEGSR